MISGTPARMALLFLGGLLALGCGDKDDASDDTSGTDDTGGGGGGGGDNACASVMDTNRITEGTADLEVFLDGGGFPVALDASAEYDAETSLWITGAAPAACGKVVPGIGLLLMVQLHEGGVPVLKMQASGLGAGEHALADAVVPTTVVLSDGSPAALLYQSGSVTFGPDPLPESGEITVTFTDGAGEYSAVGDDSAFSLSGTLTVTLP